MSLSKNECSKVLISSIPKLIDWNYAVDWDLGYIEDNLNHYADDYGLVLNPDFQRGHVWTTEQRIRFMEYVVRGGKVYAPIIFNSPAFAGHSSTKECDLPEVLIIVDGLQRLTTYRMFMRDELAIFGGYKLSDFDKPKVMTRGIRFRVAVNTLQTRKELLQFYLELNEGHVAHSEEELARVKALIEAECKK